MKSANGKKIELLWIENNNVINFWSLEADKLYNIGRYLDNHIIIYTPSISKIHAIIYVKKDYTVGIMDITSKNGTRINDKMLIPEEWYQLEDNNKIYLGSKSEYMFESYLLLKIRDVELNPTAIQDDSLLTHSNPRDRFVISSHKPFKKIKCKSLKILKPQRTIRDVNCILRKKRRRPNNKKKTHFNKDKI